VISATIPEHLAGVRPHTVGLCETQPATAEGLRAAVAGAPDMECPWCAHTLPLGLELTRRQAPQVVVLDKGFGLQPVLEALALLRAAGAIPVVWGVSMTEAEAIRLLQAGARGILRKTADLDTVLACLRAVAGGSNWMDDGVFRESLRVQRLGHSELTAREVQVLELVEQGMKNREIAQELGIRPGTVKIHLKHIFEKTGVRGRYGLALNGLRQHGASAQTRLREQVVA
jgi:two-component system, NarL family, nitrate/nitrite response regulator NarL